MKIILFAPLAFFILNTTAAQKGKVAVKKPTVAVNKFKNLQDSASYLLGYNVGQNLMQQYGSFNLNVDVFSKAIKEALQMKNCTLDQNMASQLVNNYFMQQSAKKAVGAKKIGAQFLTENKKKQGVVTTASGLQYEVIKEGTGPKAMLTDSVLAHYTGTLLNGFEFDNSYKRNEPYKFAVTGVIKGWTEALQLMNEGAKLKLYIPSELAYGDYGSGGDIGPGETLVFEVEIIQIIKPSPNATEKRAEQKNN
jgi:FKBP-type peptidyl-prolyl cis-trans isomerase FklB